MAIQSSHVRWTDGRSTSSGSMRSRAATPRVSASNATPAASGSTSGRIDPSSWPRSMTAAHPATARRSASTRPGDRCVGRDHRTPQGDQRKVVRCRCDEEFQVRADHEPEDVERACLLAVEIGVDEGGDHRVGQPLLRSLRQTVDHGVLRAEVVRGQGAAHARARPDARQRRPIDAAFGDERSRRVEEGLLRPAPALRLRAPWIYW